MNSNTIQILGTREAFHEVFSSYMWRKYRSLVFCSVAIPAGLLVIFFAVNDIEAPLYGWIIGFACIFLLYWNVAKSSFLKNIKRQTEKIWENIPDGKIYLELRESGVCVKTLLSGEQVPPPKLSGLSKFLASKIIRNRHTSFSTPSVKISKIETHLGHSVIFANIGIFKNQIWFVAEVDVTDFLNAWRMARVDNTTL